MDSALHCNTLKCRRELTDRAVVTTCSHIFCLNCSESLPGLAPGEKRRCPACETYLTHPDDAVVTQLNPTEDYKTSVLSGLSPSIIMECASRGLSFYSYQTAQEVLYQGFVAKSLTDKYNSLSSQMDSVINDANSEITGLREKMQSMQVGYDTLEKKNRALSEAFKEKSRTQAQLQKLYTTLKQQQIAGGIELAAEHDAENALHAGQYPTASRQGGLPVHSRAGSGGSGGGGAQARQATRPWESQFQGSRNGLQTARSAPVHNTPSNHRTRLTVPPQDAYGMNHGTGYQATPHRAPMQNLDGNIYGNVHHGGYGGMSAGMKMGRQQTGPINRDGMGGRRSPNYVGLNVR